MRKRTSFPLTGLLPAFALVISAGTVSGAPADERRNDATAASMAASTDDPSHDEFEACRNRSGGDPGAMIDCAGAAIEKAMRGVDSPQAAQAFNEALEEMGDAAAAPSGGAISMQVEFSYEAVQLARRRAALLSGAALPATAPRSRALETHVWGYAWAKSRAISCREHAVPDCAARYDALLALAPSATDPDDRRPADGPGHAGGGGLSAQIDPDFFQAKTAQIVSSEAIEVGGEPGCAYVVRYPGHVDQPVTWNGETCDRVAAIIVSTEELERAGQLQDLPQEAQMDIERMDHGVFVIESTFTASAYPLNVAGRVYEVPYGD